MVEPDPDIIAHYEERYDEDTRLERDPVGRLELARTRIILERHLPPPPASILDVGSGPGVYAQWLVASGYEVDLVDVVPRHVRQAAARGLRARLGDARALPAAHSSYDAVLLLGPLYHLPDLPDRMLALDEARRVARPGAPVLVAAISHYAPAIDGLVSGYIDDAAFTEIMTTDLDHGSHFNPTGNPNYFTTAFFHRPDELAGELNAAGFDDVTVLAVEGVGWSAVDLGSRMGDTTKLERLMALLERLETEPSLLGASPHLLGVGRKP